MKITFIFSCSGMFQDVPGCSGMFRNVPECCEMFHVPAFIDALLLIKKRMTWFTPRLNSVKIEIKAQLGHRRRKKLFSKLKFFREM